MLSLDMLSVGIGGCKVLVSVRQLNRYVRYILKEVLLGAGFCRGREVFERSINKISKVISLNAKFKFEPLRGHFQLLFSN